MVWSWVVYFNSLSNMFEQYLIIRIGQLKMYYVNTMYVTILPSALMISSEFNHDQIKAVNEGELMTRSMMNDYDMLGLFQLSLNSRSFNLLSCEQLPDSSSIILISKCINKDIESWRGLCHNRSNLQRHTDLPY